MVLRTFMRGLHAAALGVALFFAGFAVFILLIPRGVDVATLQLPATVETLVPPPQAARTTMVVFTGDGGRLDAAAALLQGGVQTPFLISGVHPYVTLQTLKLTAADLGLPGPLPFIHLDYQADTTRENVLQAVVWAGNLGRPRVILITSAYHMPRSLLLFRMFAPQVEVVPLPVARNAPPRFLLREYVKLLVAPFLP